jgi:endonuclease IV
MIFGCHVNRYHAQKSARGAPPTLAAHIRAAAAEAADECGVALRCAQVFVGGPGRREITLTAAEAAELRELASGGGGAAAGAGAAAAAGAAAGAAAAPIKLYAHSVYVAPPWGGDPDAARFIRDELAVCARAGICGLVIHLPKAPIATVVKYAPRLINPDARGVRIFFETPAVTPAETYYESPEKLGALLAALREVDPADELFGVCVDTAHIWTSGIDIQRRDAAADWLARLAAQFEQLGRPGLLQQPGRPWRSELSARVIFHANDSARPRGVGPDTHAGFAVGRIWGEYFDSEAAAGAASAAGAQSSGLAAFVEFAAEHQCAFILERKPKEALRSDYRIMASLEPSTLLSAASALALASPLAPASELASARSPELSATERAQVWVRAAALALSPAEGRARAGRLGAARQRLLGALLEPSLNDAQRLQILAASGRGRAATEAADAFVADGAQLIASASASASASVGVGAPLSSNASALMYVAHAGACCAPAPAEGARALARALGLAAARVCLVSDADFSAQGGAEPKLSFERCGAASLPEGAADVCALLMVAHHAPALLAAAARALRPGGLLLLCEYVCADGASAAVDRALFDVAHDLYCKVQVQLQSWAWGLHLTYRSADGWAAAARECGLEEVGRAQKDAPLPLMYFLFRRGL